MDIKAYIESGILENFVLGTTSQEENSILECVMANNLEVRTAVIEMQKTLEHLATLDAVEAPKDIRSQIFSKLNFSDTAESTKVLTKEIPISTPLKVENIEHAVVEKKNNVSSWLAAASLLLLMAFGWTMYKNQQIQENLVATSNQIREDQKQLQTLADQNAILRSANRIQLNGVEKHPDMLANVYWDKEDMVYLSVENLPTAPEGKEYQLWAIVDGKPVDAGMYNGTEAGKMQEMKHIKNAQAFAITLEKKGGSATPTMEDMYVMGTV